jgi:hypothetical protein
MNRYRRLVTAISLLQERTTPPKLWHICKGHTFNESCKNSALIYPINNRSVIGFATFRLRL